MSLFSKIEVKPEMESFIAKGEGVGVVKVEDYGKASARIESHKVILESYDEEYPIIESIAAISYLSYDPGNFFQEPKLEIGLGQKKYILAGVDNNDDELEAFYKSILNLKKQEKKQTTQKTTSVIQDKQNDKFDELDELEEELENKPKTPDTTSKIKGFLTKRFEEKEEKEEQTPQEKKSSSIKQFINKKTEKPEPEKIDDLELMLDKEESFEDDDEEIILLEEEPKEKTEPEKTKNIKKEEIDTIEEYDEFDEFDEIDDFSELDEFEEDDEIILEDDNESDELTVEEDIGELTVEEDIGELTVEEDTEKSTVEEPIGETQINKEVAEQNLIPQQQPLSDNLEKTSKTKNESKGINKIKNQVVGFFTEEIEEEKPNKEIKQSTQPVEIQKPISKPTPETHIKTQKVSDIRLNKEISQVKEQVNENINNINQEISNQNTENIQTANTFDPVYQIRRYYELKEEGIISEEEFQQKKKQLLEL